MNYADLSTNELIAIAAEVLEIVAMTEDEDDYVTSRASEFVSSLDELSCYVMDEEDEEDAEDEEDEEDAEDEEDEIQ